MVRDQGPTARKKASTKTRKRKMYEERRRKEAYKRPRKREKEVVFAQCIVW